MIPAGGEIFEQLCSYYYLDDYQDGLPIYTTPHCHIDFITGEVLQPGEEFQGCAEWIISRNAFGSASSSSQFSQHIIEEEEDEDDEDGKKLCFIKLTDQRGWIESKNRSTGDAFVQKLTTNTNTNTNKKKQ